VLLIGKLTRQQHRPPPSRGNQLCSVLGILVLAQVGDCDVGALLGECDRDRTADPRVTTGDQCPLAVQQPAPDVIGHLILRPTQPTPTDNEAYAKPLENMIKN
jgi:hypothetical protein